MKNNLKIEGSFFTPKQFLFGISSMEGEDEHGYFVALSIGIFLFEITFYYYKEE